jgi:hypothetical protein
MSIIKFKSEPISRPVLIVEKEKRKNARQSPKLSVKVQVTSDGEFFEDTMILDSAIPKKSYMVFVRMKKIVPDIGEMSADERQEMTLDLMLENFAEFILPMIVSCNFEKNLETLEEFDVDIKLALFNILLNKMAEENVQEELAKK